MSRFGSASRRPATLLLTALATAGGCDGPQSGLAPVGVDAERIAALWWGMVAAGLVVWAVVVGLAIYAIWGRRQPASVRAGRRLILIGGAVLPTIILGVLLLLGLSFLPRLLAPGPVPGLRIEVTGEQWWWRVRYHPPGAAPVESANEIRLPVGERVEFTLRSPDVIHSFWIPSLGGKMDMVPGRTTRLALEARSAGIFRGTCAEYCGSSHALMSFVVVVMEPDAFSAWLARERGDAARPSGPAATRGGELFVTTGCGACHTVRGTPAAGSVGPDLTRVGSRLSLAAGIMPNDEAAFVRWLSATEQIKPGVHMPAFGMLPAGELAALAAYLDALR